MKRCIIMRGLPGSGKSTWIQENEPNFYSYSADHYHTKGGVYQFDPSKVREAHNWCLGRFAQGSSDGCPQIAVDNTNVRAFEFAPYYRLAEAFGYQVDIVWVIAPIEKCILRNVHGVPPETIQRMARSFEPIPDWWNVRMIVKE
jgi:predicted kinase